MPSVTLKEISVSFGHRQLLEEVNFSVSKGDRVALTGANGSGKTTLMRVISSEIKPDTGSVIIEKNTRLAYLPQTQASLGGVSIWDEAEKAFAEIKLIIAETEELEKQLASVKEDSPVTAALLDRHHYLHETIVRSSYYTRKGIIHKVLTGLGFREKDFDKDISTFSSGWQMRIALAKVLLAQPDIMLLDEPTNYLDLEAKNWLESHILSSKTGMLIVSHDRYFLDATVKKTAEIYLRKLSLYHGNYTSYETKRAKELEKAIDAFNRQQEEIEKLEFFIKRFQYNSSKAKLVQSRMTYLKNITRLEKPPGMRKIHLAFKHPERSGDIVLELKNASVSYEKVKALESVNLTLLRGERLVLAGPNGAGKSTLMRILSGSQKPGEGSITYGKNVSIGYFSQESLDQYSGDATIIGELESIAPTELIPDLRKMLGSFLFSGDDIYKRISVLSGGEKSRLALLKLLLRPSNLLLLDEPTNHLDMVSKDILLDALKAYTATLVFVSHDRYFIQNLATKVLELDSGHATLYYGDYEYFLYRKSSAVIPCGEEKPQKEKETIKSVSEREEDKKKKNRIKKLKDEEKALLGQIDETQSRLEELEAKLSLEEVYSDHEKAKEIGRLAREKKKQHDDFFLAWEKLDEEIRALESSI